MISLLSFNETITSNKLGQRALAKELDTAKNRHSIIKEFCFSSNFDESWSHVDKQNKILLLKRPKHYSSP